MLTQAALDSYISGLDYKKVRVIRIIEDLLPRTMTFKTIAEKHDISIRRVFAINTKYVTHGIRGYK